MAHSSIILSRNYRRLGISWLATMAPMVNAEGSSMRFSSSSAHNHAALGVLQNLAMRLQEPESLRAPRVSQFSKTEGTSKIDENRRRSELASELCASYPALPPLKLPRSYSCERANIIFFLASDCSPTDADVLSAIEAFQRPSGGTHNQSTRLHGTTLSSLRRASTPAFEELLEFLLKQNTVSGMEFLNALRTDLLQLLRWLRSTTGDDECLSQLKALDDYLLRILSIWFSPGIIELKRITYESTAASIIEAIAKKEAVHPMKSLDDLRSRLGAGRRVFSLFHPVLPDKPLVFVHAALLDEIPSGMSNVMEAPTTSTSTYLQPKVVAFYSISNAQPGLAGVGLGEYLLKESIKRLKSEFPSLNSFVTLSPIPGFRKWLEDKIRNNQEGGHFYDGSLLSEEEMQSLERAGLIARDDDLWNGLLSTLDALDYGEVVVEEEENALSTQQQHQDTQTIIRPILMKLACRYLLLEKHRGRPLDAVTRFHVGNGALVHRLNFAADLTRKGLKSSYGIMVNYRYDLDQVEEKQKLYETEYQIPWEDDMEQWIQAPHSKL
mmetsp:Transcript_5967/g.9021  ORF Transcript_5967/g.9021 Transcript_5967/m.9021 type:complete len:552 (+) Transcript_5967:72-1727(+)